MKSAAAYDIVDSISDAFKVINIDNFYEKLVGFGGDGASVNHGKKQSVKAILREENPWLTFGWCVAHRLELALKDCLNGTAFDDIDEIILRLHYLYKKSPKKLRQLKELVTIYEEAEEFESSSYRPKKASGTRWIAHKVASLEVILDKYGIYLQHMENLAEDKSYPREERAKFKGWIRKWTEARIPLLIALFLEILAPAKLLSKSFQSEEIDVVASIDLIKKVKSQLSRLENRTFENLPTVRRLVEKIKEDDGDFIFQDIKLKGYVKALETIKKVKENIIPEISKALKTRLEESDDDNSMIIAKILNTDGWISFKDNPELLDK